MPAVATRSQLYAGGYSRAALDAQINGRRWRALNELVVCLHNGPMTLEEQRLAVYLSAPSPAALCGWTALDLWLVRGFTSGEIHLVVPRGSRPAKVDGISVRVHESRRFTSDDVWIVGGLGVTEVHRSVIDACAWTRRPADAARLLVASVQQRRARPGLLREALDAAGRVQHRQLLMALIADLEGGAQALSEVAFLAFCRRHGFPPPRLQVRDDTNRRRRYLDAEFRTRSGRIVRVEIDGGVHLSLTERWKDTAKDNELAIEGRSVLRFPSVAIYTDDPLAVAQLRRALGLVRAEEGSSPRQF